MSKFTAEEVAAMAAKYNYPPDAIGYRHNKLHEMLEELRRRLRQEEEEMRRDPVVEPRPGDRIECATSTAVWVGKAYPCSEGGLQCSRNQTGDDMSKFTADEVMAELQWGESGGDLLHGLEMLRELARRLRQEEEENRRDPVRQPLTGDRIEWPDGDESVWTERDAENIEEGETLSQWRNACKTDGAKIIRRREAQP